MQDGQPAFNLMDLRRLTLSSVWFDDEENLRYLLQNAKSLEKLHLYIAHENLWGLHDILSLSPRTLKVFDLSLSLSYAVCLALTGPGGDFETMAGRNMLEALFCELQVDGNASVDALGSILRRVEEVLMKPGWPALRQVSFNVEILPLGDSVSLSEALQSLPDKYLSHLPKHESIAFNFSAYVSTWSAYHCFFVSLKYITYIFPFSLGNLEIVDNVMKSVRFFDFFM